jgi:hypothetical protein
MDRVLPLGPCVTVNIESGLANAYHQRVAFASPLILLNTRCPDLIHRLGLYISKSGVHCSLQLGAVEIGYHG